ncbi:hypothetical protein ACFC34_31535 [Streptomyces sp. NPDC056053]|uniref:hypothetical protein n=1 Tax=Streptomyces sp. NPDC056053 TaxID=3345696 RepID=UPI0035E24A3C
MAEVGEGLEDRPGVPEADGIEERDVAHPEAGEAEPVGELCEARVVGKVRDAVGAAGRTVGRLPGGAPVVVEGEFQAEGEPALAGGEAGEGGVTGCHG